MLNSLNLKKNSSTGADEEHSRPSLHSKVKTRTVEYTKIKNMLLLGFLTIITMRQYALHVRMV